MNPNHVPDSWIQGRPFEDDEAARDRCPRDGTTLEFVSGTYGTGVFAPDGGQEMRDEEGLYCETCDRVYDEDFDF